jgi:SAM-dependent methyltransferase
VSKAAAFGGPVLDLACGTGRLALVLARKGFEVTGIDQSEGMLEQFHAKLQAEPPEVRRRVHIANQRVADFALEQQFNTILCCDGFFHNLTVEDEMNCLGCVARHLAPGGRFVFNLPNPTCDFLLKSARSKNARSAGTVFEERGRYTLDDPAGSLLVEQAQSASLLNQTITTTLRITRSDSGGREVEQGESAWTSRYLFRYEAIHLLYRCGFEVEELVGDYKNGPVTEAGQLIFQVRRRDTNSA